MVGFLTCGPSKVSLVLEVLGTDEATLKDDKCRYLLAKFRPEEVPWVLRGSGPCSCPYLPECAEGKFSEVQIHDPAKLAPLGLHKTS
jgi:hypothetical protein